MFQDRLFKRLVLNGIELIILIVFRDSMSFELKRTVGTWRDTVKEYVESL